MGVVYKIKKEIVEFILQKKKEDLSFSCRGMVELIKQKFNTALSKSSINSIIKDANLSSGVGRKRKILLKPEELPEEAAKAEAPIETPPQPETPKPEEPSKEVAKPEAPIETSSQPEISRKEELTEKTALVRGVIEKSPQPETPKPEELPKETIVSGAPKEELPRPQTPKTEGLPKDTPKTEVPKEELPRPPTPKPEELPKDAPKTEALKKEASQPESPKPPIIPEEKTEEELKVEFDKVELRENRIFNGMGGFLLKAAELEACDGPILAQLFNKGMPERLVKELGFLSDAVLYTPIFNIKYIEEIYNEKADALWFFSEYKKSPEELVLKYIERLESIQNLSAMCRDGCRNFFRKVNSLKVCLKDKTSFYIDGRFNTLWMEPGISDYFSTTFHKASSYVNKFFVENSEPLIILTASGYKFFSRLVSEFALACEGAPEKKIVKVEFLNGQDGPANEVVNIPQAKRYFIFGFWPWQKEFAELEIKKAKATGSFKFEDMKKDLYYIEGHAEFAQTAANEMAALRYVLLKDSPGAPSHMGIITNIHHEKKNVDELIELYLRRWPNLDEFYKDFFNMVDRQGLGGPPEPSPGYGPYHGPAYPLGTTLPWVWDEIGCVFGQMSSYAQHRFFPPEYRRADFSKMKENFYSLPGRIKRTRDRLVITLLVGEDYGFYNDLLYAVKRINESDIRDNLGSRLFFTTPQKTVYHA